VNTLYKCDNEYNNNNNNRNYKYKIKYEFVLETNNFRSVALRPTRDSVSSFLRFLDHTERRITVGRTTLDEGSAISRGLYLTTNNTHKRQTSTPLAILEPTIPASERPQTHALDRAATGTDSLTPPGELSKSCSVVLLLRNPAAGRHSVVLCFYCSDFRPFRLLFSSRVLRL